MPPRKVRGDRRVGLARRGASGPGVARVPDESGPDAPVSASGRDRRGAAGDQGGEAVVEVLILDDEEQAAATILAALAGLGVAGNGALLVHVAEDRIGVGAAGRDSDLAVVAAAAPEVDRLAGPMAAGRDRDRAR